MKYLLHVRVEYEIESDVALPSQLVSQINLVANCSDAIQSARQIQYQVTVDRIPEKIDGV